MTLIPDQALYTAAQVRELDRRAIEAAGIDDHELMTRAGQAAFRRLQHHLQGPVSRARRLCVLAGPGNNGGDGYVIARLAREAGIDAVVLPLGEHARLEGAADQAREQWLAGGGVYHQASGLPSDCDLIVDALFGTGLSRPIEGIAREWVERVNAHPAPVLAVDCPSGLDADSGQVLGVAVEAELTVSFIGLKRGLFTGQAADFTGRVFLERLGVPDAAYQGLTPSAFRTGRDDVAALLPPRRRASHKGEHGHVRILGGAPGMGGLGDDLFRRFGEG
jgi:ADP-dependent NAD(P)H-hydrate dehydratase / NAD(P)H-hydrate epimerase